MTDVSIVMACKDSKNSIIQTINSVLNQTYTNFELIIVDDGSRVPISNIIEDINDNRIKQFRISPSGLGAALNFGIAKSSGILIARIDDDDFMDPKRIQKQRDKMCQNNNISCLGTQIFLKNSNKFLKHRKFPLNHNEILRDLIKCKFSLAHCSVMYRKDTFEKIGGYRISGGGQDLDLFLQLSRHGILSNLDEYLTYYNVSTEGLSMKVPSYKYRSYLFALESIEHDDSFTYFTDNINASINNLNRKLKTKIIFRNRLKRLLLVVYIIVKGKNLTVS